MNPEAKILSGIAGEYFVAGELSRRGYIASLTLRNTANIDILASNGNKAVNIQVKTRRIDKIDGWDLGDKPLEWRDEWKDVFYTFVAISSDPNEKDVSCLIIPKNELNKAVEDNFQAWKKIPKKSGEAKTSNRRIFRIAEYPKFQSGYEDNWNQIFS